MASEKSKLIGPKRRKCERIRMSETVLLLSIRPQHGEQILAGRKKVELRKVRPKVVGQGDLVLLYFSAPEKALVGAFWIDSIVVDEPQQLWLRIGQAACISKDRYRKYVGATKRVCGILIDKVWRLHEEISLAELRNRIPGFSPPQSFKYLKPKEVHAILRPTRIIPQKQSANSSFRRDSSFKTEESSGLLLSDGYKLFLNIGRL